MCFRLEKPGPNATEEEIQNYLVKLCSNVTLHSPKIGFFNHYVDQIDEQVSENFIEKFGKIKTDEERILTAWGVKVSSLSESDIV